ncbi:unnamed protein product [Hymenolepis diminuta]|uniref:Uncharacterized protein n=1 Tax=Hymenolepis diminuta TaxID=6216 RepID=A0A564YQF0_HYMDI|nr:unnamed protein product [Hymenolepis diminuta]
MRSLIRVTHIKPSLFSTQEQCTHVSCRPLRFMFIASLPQHFPLSLSLCHSFQTRCFLEYIFGLINSWCSALQLVLAIAQTAINW